MAGEHASARPQGLRVRWLTARRQAVTAMLEELRKHFDLDGCPDSVAGFRLTGLPGTYAGLEASLFARPLVRIACGRRQLSLEIDPQSDSQPQADDHCEHLANGRPAYARLGSGAAAFMYTLADGDWCADTCVWPPLIRPLIRNAGII